jgi:hypothetical protein
MFRHDLTFVQVNNEEGTVAPIDDDEVLRAGAGDSHASQITHARMGDMPLC